jgi:hypothetical protein
MNPKQYGLILPEITPDHWVLGAANSGASGDIINTPGNWIPYLPDKEPQEKNSVETQNCSGFGTDNAVETLSALRGIKANYSDRYLGIMAGTDPYKGNDPHIVAETLRKTSGQIDEALLPFSDDITTPEAYYQPKPMTPELSRKGQRWYDQWDFNHEWVFTTGTPQQKREKLKDAITKGTVCISVTAWFFDSEKGYYIKPADTTDNHWCQLVKIEDGKYIIFDSYDGYLKDLDPLFDFAIAKIYYLTPAAPKIAIFAQILNFIGQILHIDTLLIQKPPIVVNPPQQLPVVTPSYPSPTQPSRIAPWASVIRTQEGWTPGSRSFRNNNPGNLKYTPYTHSLGATAHDADNFCIFPNADHGFSALMQFLTDACKGNLKSYSPDMTLDAFTTTYANPPSKNYVNRVADALKVDEFIQIKKLL